MTLDDSITLQQGLDIFQNKNLKYFSKRSISKKGEEFLICHDIAHVVFGCGTTMYGEGVVKIWTTFGTTLSFRKVVGGYSDANAFQLSQEFSIKHVLSNILKLLAVIPKTIIRAKRMSKPWPFTEYKPYLNIPISEIRKEFNIEILS